MKLRGITMTLAIASSLALPSIALMYYRLGRAEPNENRFSSASKDLGSVIIDTDAGGDDAAALLLALGAEKQSEKSTFRIIAITCTYGNTHVDNVAINVLKILAVANRSDIPVYVGARGPLLKKFQRGSYFGEDGLGDFDFPEEILGRVDRSKHASVAMADLARENPGKISVIALGPLTNVALAMTLDHHFAGNIERFYVLGSSVRGLGNVAPNVEFNFSQDPHANYVVLNGTIDGQPALLFPWETTLRAAVSMEWRTKVLGSVDSRTIGYLNKMEKAILGEATWNPADLMLIACLVWPELTTSTSVTNVTPVFDGAAQGTVLVDYTGTTGKLRNAEILETFDVESFKQRLLMIFSE